MISLPKLNIGRERSPMKSAFTTEFDFDNYTRGYLNQQTDNSQKLLDFKS